MKAALEAWGSETNLFHQGFARETEDPAIVAAAIARPGVVLRRPVGSNAAFSEHAKLPKDLSTVEANRLHDQLIAKSPVTPVADRDDKIAREAAITDARDKEQRDRERRKKEVALEAQRKRRSKSIERAEAALEVGKRIHDTKTDEIAAARFALDRQSEAEENRWDKQRAELQAALDRARL